MSSKEASKLPKEDDHDERPDDDDDDDEEAEFDGEEEDSDGEGEPFVLTLSAVSIHFTSKLAPTPTLELYMHRKLIDFH